MKGYCYQCDREVEWDEYKGDGYAELRGNSHAVLRENSHAELWGNSHAVSNSPYAQIVIKYRDATGSGNVVGDKPIRAEDYLRLCNVFIKRGKVILFKSLNKDWTSRNGMTYKIGEITVAPDWDADFKDECGKGLHFSPTVAQAKSFRDEGLYVACEVSIKDLADLPAYAEYPDKIRARACKTLYQVDEKGNKIESLGKNPQE